MLSFLRLPVDQDSGKPLACIANLSPMPREGYRIGVPQGGWWREVLNTDATDFWGSGLASLPDHTTSVANLSAFITDLVTAKGAAAPATLTPAIVTAACTVTLAAAPVTLY